MLYLILGRDGEDSLPRRMQSRADHLQRLESLRDAGRLVLAGPLPRVDAADPGPAGFAGSAIIAEFDSLTDAREWAQADPYMSAGVYQSLEVHPFRKVLP